MLKVMKRFHGSKYLKISDQETDDDMTEREQVTNQDARKFTAGL